MTKVEQWQQFSKLVEKHIESYAIGQYGDFGDPKNRVANFNADMIQGKLDSYIGRINSGMRGPEEGLRVTLKIAHFACFLYAYLTTWNAEGSIK